MDTKHRKVFGITCAHVVENEKVVYQPSPVDLEDSKESLKQTISEFQSAHPSLQFRSHDGARELAMLESVQNYFGNVSDSQLQVVRWGEWNHTEDWALLEVDVTRMSLNELPVRRMDAFIWGGPVVDLRRMESGTRIYKFGRTTEETFGDLWDRERRKNALPYGGFRKRRVDCARKRQIAVLTSGRQQSLGNRQAKQRPWLRHLRGHTGR